MTKYSKIQLTFMYAILVILLSNSYLALAQHTIYNPSANFSNNIHSVQLHPKSQKQSPPIILLDSQQQLKLSFDDFADQLHDYSYTLLHCKANWQTSGLHTNEYLAGFDNASIYNYSNSMNTLQSYTHYQLLLPNDDIQFTKSGNYLLIIYIDDNKDNKLLQLRLMIYEDKVQITSKIKRPLDKQWRYKGQELEININHPSYNIADAYNTTYLVISQNNIPSQTHSITKPQFVKPNSIEYIDTEDNIWPGNNEFRWFNTQDIHSPTIDHQRIYYNNNLMQFDLQSFASRSPLAYTFHQDINGSQLISLQGSSQSNTEADYTWVSFMLASPQALTGGNMYIVGAFSQWQALDKYKMHYNFAEHSYQLTTIFKQGYYNFSFAYTNNQHQPHSQQFEGSHYETENDYHIYFYHNSWQDAYDRLVGYKKTNNIKRL